MENGKAPIKFEESSLPFVLMDKLDDDLIIQELEGRLPDILTYHFQDKGQEIWGISKAGVDEAKGELAKQGEVIREMEVTYVDKDIEAMFNVKAGRYAISKDGREVLLDTAFGFKRQPKKTPKGYENPFWYEQGAIKACRNASMRLIPKSIQQAVIEYAKKNKKVKEVKTEKQEPPPEPLKEPFTFDSAMKRMEDIKNLFELKAWWVKHFPEIKTLDADAQRELTAFKDHLKSEFENPTKFNSGEADASH